MDDLLDKTTLKIRNDQQIQAETARRYHTDVEINRHGNLTGRKLLAMDGQEQRCRTISLVQMK